MLLVVLGKIYNTQISLHYFVNNNLHFLFFLEIFSNNMSLLFFIFNIFSILTIDYE